MNKYRFTGHLYPTPPGYQPFELSGEVYIASEVEEWQRKLEFEHDRARARLRERLDQVLAANRSLRKRLRKQSVLQNDPGRPNVPQGSVNEPSAAAGSL